jgi:hypothetical protein
MAELKNKKVKDEFKEEQPNMLTREQYNQLVRADTIKKVNTFLKGMGTIFVVIVYFLMAEFLWEVSWFGALFPGSRDEFTAFWKFISTDINSVIIPDVDSTLISGKIFDDWFKWGTWIPQACMTVFLCLLTIGIAYIIAFSINDIISMVKNLLVNSKKTLTDIGQTATQNINKGLGIEDTVENIRKPKKLLDDDIPSNIKESNNKKAKNKKTKEEKEQDEVDALLKELLTHPHTAQEEEAVEIIAATPTDDLLGLGSGRIDEE